MIIDENEMKQLLIKYEEDTTFNNEVVLSDVLNLIDTVRYWKRQSSVFKATRKLSD